MYWYTPRAVGARVLEKRRLASAKTTSPVKMPQMKLGNSRSSNRHPLRPRRMLWRPAAAQSASTDNPEPISKVTAHNSEIKSRGVQRSAAPLCRGFGGLPADRQVTPEVLSHLGRAPACRSQGWSAQRPALQQSGARKSRQTSIQHPKPQPAGRPRHLHLRPHQMHRPRKQLDLRLQPQLRRKLLEQTLLRDRIHR